MRGQFYPCARARQGCGSSWMARCYESNTFKHLEPAALAVGHFLAVRHSGSFGIRICCTLAAQSQNQLSFPRWEVALEISTPKLGRECINTQGLHLYLQLHRHLGLHRLFHLEHWWRMAHYDVGLWHLQGA